MLRTPAATSRSHTACAAWPGVAIMPIVTPRSAQTAGMSRTCSTRMPLIVDADEVRVDVEQRGDREAAAAEAAVAGERVAEVADADQRDGLPVVEAERPLQLVRSARTS